MSNIIEREIIDLLSIFLDRDSLTIEEFEGITKIQTLCRKIQDKYEFDVAYQKKSNENRTTDIPEDRWGVHKSHCCVLHWCKYWKQWCPVELAIIKQDYKCEVCNN